MIVHRNTQDTVAGDGGVYGRDVCERDILRPRWCLVHTPSLLTSISKQEGKLHYQGTNPGELAHQAFRYNTKFASNILSTRYVKSAGRSATLGRRRVCQYEPSVAAV